MNNRVIGSILMILGTSIGAGMLALPVATAGISVSYTAGLLLGSWALMTLGALCILEVNLWQPQGSHLVSMAKETLGSFGQCVTWLVYLLLLYALLCAYLAGVGDILQALLLQVGLSLPRVVCTLMALLLLAGIVYHGIGWVDGANRFLMTVKLLSYIFLLVLMVSHVQAAHWSVVHSQWHASILLVIMTSFGYAIIVPTLRSYLDSDARALKRVVFWGSLLPLIIYLVWIVVVQGTVSRVGVHGLLAMGKSANTNSMLMHAVSSIVDIQWLGFVGKVLVSVCVLTSFLGVSICLVDFLADGIKINKHTKKGLILYVIAYLPPFVIVTLMPSIFIKALSYAGICCVVLLILMPIIMCYKGRYRSAQQGVLCVPGGRWVLSVGFVLGLSVLALIF